MKPLTEKPSANQLKFTARSAGAPIEPMTLFRAMCCIMNAVPTMAAVANSTGISREAKGSSTPAATMAPAMAIGRKAPTRSISRPPCTASSIGNTA